MKLFVNSGSNIEWDEQDVVEACEPDDAERILRLAVGQSYEDGNDAIWRRVQ